MGDERAIIWLDQPASVEIVDGVACVSIASGGDHIAFRLAISTLRKSYRSAGAALAMHDAKPSNVQPLRGAG